jgi:hypothetical protein
MLTGCASEFQFEVRDVAQIFSWDENPKRGFSRLCSVLVWDWRNLCSKYIPAKRGGGKAKFHLEITENTS